MPTLISWPKSGNFTGGIRLEGFVFPAARSHPIKLHLSLMLPGAFHFQRPETKWWTSFGECGRVLACDSPFVKASIHEAALDGMKSKGLECDAGIVGPTVGTHSTITCPLPKPVSQCYAFNPVTQQVYKDRWQAKPIISL